MADLQVDPQVAAQVTADLHDVHAVLGTCGMLELATRTRFPTIEGFLSQIQVHGRSHVALHSG